MELLNMDYPTDPFTTLELYNPSRDVSEPHKTSRSRNIEALKLGKGRSGINPLAESRRDLGKRRT